MDIESHITSSTKSRHGNGKKRKEGATRERQGVGKTASRRKGVGEGRPPHERSQENKSKRLYSLAKREHHMEVADIQLMQVGANWLEESCNEICPDAHAKRAVKVGCWLQLWHFPVLSISLCICINLVRWSILHHLFIQSQAANLWTFPQTVTRSVSSRSYLTRTDGQAKQKQSAGKAKENHPVWKDPGLLHFRTLWRRNSSLKALPRR